MRVETGHGVSIQMPLETLFSNTLFSGHPIDLNNADYLEILGEFDEGVIIADMSGRIVYYNRTQAKIDDLEPEYALGKKVIEIYDLTDKDSVIMRCLKSGESVINHTFFYRTRLGKVANTIHSVFPLYKGRDRIGAICFVKDYNLLEKTLFYSDSPRKQKSSGNGTRFVFDDVIGETPEILQAVKTAKMAADSPSPVMLMGKTGTGKELFAQSIHNYGGRKQRPYVAINCAAIPENLLEGNLFGTARGAFTGALDKAGLFEQANGGTLFLDEIDSMPVGLQAKLLRVLQEKKVRRIGSLDEAPIDLKIISSVNTSPHRSIEKGVLRNDLYYRLGVVFISLPPLRERRGDIAALTRHFVEKSNGKLGKNVKAVSSRILDFFMDYHWPGNVRELEHVIEGGMNMVDREDLLTVSHLSTHFAANPAFRDFENQTNDAAANFFLDPGGRRGSAGQVRITLPASSPAPPGRSLVEARDGQERQMVEEALKAFRGNVTRAACSLGISRQLMNYKIKKYSLNRKDYL